MKAPEPTKRLSPRLYTFRVRLHGEKWFSLYSIFATSEEQAKVSLNQRFSGKIIEWKRTTPNS
jgi:hypothetical protein